MLLLREEVAAECAHIGDVVPARGCKVALHGDEVAEATFAK
jgi:hypothetical protein